MKLYNKLVKRGGNFYALWFLLISLALMALGFILLPDVSPDLKTNWLKVNPGLFLVSIGSIFAVIPFYYYTSSILKIKSTLHEALVAVVYITAISFVVGLIMEAVAPVEWIYGLTILTIEIAVIKKIYNISLWKSVFFFIISTIFILVFSGVIILFIFLV